MYISRSSMPINILSCKILEVVPVEDEGTALWGLRLENDRHFVIDRSKTRKPRQGEYVGLLYYGPINNGEFEGYGCWGLVIDEYEERYFLQDHIYTQKAMRGN